MKRLTDKQIEHRQTGAMNIKRLSLEAFLSMPCTNSKLRNGYGTTRGTIFKTLDKIK